MEIKINLNPHILNWLDSMGYAVSGMPREIVEGMFLREARQWGVPPERLQEMVMEHTLPRRTHSAALLAREG